MLRMSYSDHFLSVIRPSVCLCIRASVNIFKRLLLWSHWANFAQISYGASLDWGIERLLKWSWSIDQDGLHAHVWKKPLKIFFSRTKDALELNLCIKDGRSIKFAKMMVVRWRLTFLRQGQVCFPVHLYGSHTFVWEKCWEFQTASPLKQLGQC